MSDLNFPDRPSVDFIREALWSGSSVGRAAVMIGAGFSRNARATTFGATSMLDWRGLIEALCDRLYAPSGGERHQGAVAMAAATSGFLRLAQEYEAVFGRPALDQCIRDLISDSGFVPDTLHQQLLRLRWADVFTTNWDTLLERARYDVFERNYDVVSTMSEMPASARPRIVKLHGTLPSNTPFILTEEDYRTYPRLFAPFVNMVQQSMMENVLCLLGFSGDDPNFLHWSGWVRDNLGQSAPKIYLVGWLDLSSQRRRMLEERNVVPIDLSLLPHASNWPEDLRHRYAAEWFLWTLEVGRPYRNESWPHPDVRATPPKHLGLVPQPNRREPKDEKQRSNQFREKPTSEKIELINDLAASWAWNRELYPGWIVCPSGVRDYLWMRTRDAVGEIASVIPSMRRTDALAVLRELFWRAQTALMRCDKEVFDLAVEVLNSIDWEKQQIEGRSGEKEEATYGWVKVREAWLQVALEVLRFVRLYGTHNEFQRVLDSISEVPGIDTTTSQSLIYERCLRNLAFLEDAELFELLESWKPAPDDPQWSLRKAGLLSELGELDQASNLLRDALKDLRRKRRRDRPDIPALSREAWALWLALAYDRRSRSDDGLSVDERPFDRWQALASDSCDARAELFALHSKLDSVEKKRRGVVKERGFDLGHRTVTQHWVTGAPDRLVAAHQMLRLMDVTGLPMVADHQVILGHGAARAAEILGETEFWTATLLVIRIASGDQDANLKAFFSRSRIASYTDDQVVILGDALLRRIDFLTKHMEGSDKNGRVEITSKLAATVEILSRLVIRLPVPDTKSVLQRAIEMYQSGRFNNSYFMARPLAHLMKRSVEALPVNEASEHLPDLFSLPVSGEEEFPTVSRDWPDTGFMPLRGALKFLVGHGVRSDRWNGIVQRIVAVLNAEHRDVAMRAALRLDLLYGAGLLTAEEARQYSEALWAPSHLSSDGLPEGIDFNPWTFLSTPQVIPGQAEQGLRARYLELPNGSTEERVKESLRALGMAALAEGRSALEFTGDDKIKLRGLLKAWCAAPASRVKRHSDHILDNEMRLLEALTKILLSAEPSGELMQCVWTKMEDIEQVWSGETVMFGVYPAVLSLMPEKRELLVQRLRRGLVDDDSDISANAMSALYIWMRTASLSPERLSLPDDDFVKEVGVSISVRRKSSLPVALDLARWIYREGPERYRTKLATDCNHGLRYLLDETNYSKLDNLAAADFDVPLVRARCIKLVLAMESAEFIDEEVRALWKEQAKTDPLPEVRNALHNWRVED